MVVADVVAWSSGDGRGEPQASGLGEQMRRPASAAVQCAVASLGGVDVSTGYLANSFDLVNVRDLDLIQQARRFCSRLVIGVFTDDFAENRLGRRPLVPTSERMVLVSHLRGVDEVVEHDSDFLDLSGYSVVFAVVGDPVPHFRDVTLLLPSRQTASVVLREALQPVLREDVA